MFSWSWSYELQGAARNWFVGGMFLLVGIGLGVGGYYIPLEPADEIARWILWALAGVFGVLGGAVLLMMLSGKNEQDVSTIGGLMGALSYGLPATFVLPGLYVYFQGKLNSEQWMLGIIFSVTGIITTVASIALARYQLRTGKGGWSWSWSSDGGVKKDDSDSVSS